MFKAILEERIAYFVDWSKIVVVISHSLNDLGVLDDPITLEVK